MRRIPVETKVLLFSWIFGVIAVLVLCSCSIDQGVRHEQDQAQRSSQGTQSQDVIYRFENIRLGDSSSIVVHIAPQNNDPRATTQAEAAQGIEGGEIGATTSTPATSISPTLSAPAL